jgi:hypothetical protein
MNLGRIRKKYINDELAWYSATCRADWQSALPITARYGAYHGDSQRALMIEIISMQSIIVICKTESKSEFLQCVMASPTRAPSTIIRTPKSHRQAICLLVLH